MVNQLLQHVCSSNPLRILVLAGIHGREDGTVGQADLDLFEDYEDVVAGLKEDFAGDIAEKEVEIEVFNLGDHELDGGREPEDKLPQFKKLAQNVKDKRSTIVVLAFCWTRWTQCWIWHMILKWGHIGSGIHYSIPESLN